MIFLSAHLLKLKSMVQQIKMQGLSTHYSVYVRFLWLFCMQPSADESCITIPSICSLICATVFKVSFLKYNIRLVMDSYSCLYMTDLRQQSGDESCISGVRGCISGVCTGLVCGSWQLRLNCTLLQSALNLPCRLSPAFLPADPQASTLLIKPSQHQQ